MMSSQRCAGRCSCSAITAGSCSTGTGVPSMFVKAKRAPSSRAVNASVAVRSLPRSISAASFPGAVGEGSAAEAPGRLGGPADPLDGLAPDALAGLLRAIFTAAGGTHDDWDEYDRVMAEERRTAVLVDPVRITGNG